MDTIEEMAVEHPGVFLIEEMNARGWLQRDLAYILGVSESSVNLIVAGKRGISPDMAKALGVAFGVSPELFLNLQKTYDLAQADEPNPDVAKKAKFQNVYPIREMIKRGWLQDTEGDLLDLQMERFFGVSSVDAIPHISHAAKKTSYGDATPQQIAWLYRVKQLANSIVVPRFSLKRLKEEGLPMLHSLMNTPEQVRHVPKVLNECGIRFIIIETLPQAKIDGVCFWLNGFSPVIGMSLRFDRIDNFWFVLRHELEHVILRHGKENGIIDAELEGERAGTGSTVSTEERLANQAATEFCVPQDDMNSFYLRKTPYFSERDVIGFAKRIEVHAGLVVGQIQNRTGRYNFLRKHLKNIRKQILPSTLFDGWGEIAHIEL